jgi:predicted nucleotidyltransferase
MMTRDEALHLLKIEQETLRRQFGVRRLALFGSTARAEANAGSDVDVLVDFDRPITLFDLVAVRQYLEKALGLAKVDVVPRDCVYPEFLASITQEAVDVD